MADDYSQDTSTTGILPIGGTITAALEYFSDSDWFKVTLEKGKTYLFAWEKGSTLSHDGYLMLQLQDGNGQVLTENTGWAWQSKEPIVQITADRSGDYYLIASRPNSMGSPPGSYVLSARIQPTDAVPSDISSTAVLLPGGSVFGQFEVSGDRDWYKFHAEGGKFYNWTYSNLVGGNIPILDIEIYDANGKPLDPYNPLEPAVSGDYFISVQGQAGNYNLISVELVDDYAINDKTTTGVLQLGKAVIGGIQHRFDKDSFKLSAQAGQYYQVTLDADPRDITRLEFDWQSTTDTADYHVVRSATGVVTMTIHAKVTGDIFVHVAEVAPSTRPWIGSYTLSTTLAADTFAPTIVAKPERNVAIDPYNDITLTFDEPFKLIEGATLTIRDANYKQLALNGGQPKIVGNTLVFDPVDALPLDQDYTLTLSPGSISDFLGNVIDAYPAYLYFSTAKYSIIGSSGNDQLTAGGSGSTISGMEGRDTVSYSLASSMFTLHRENDYVTVTRNGSASGDRLTSIERLHFADADIALDIHGNGGQAYRMYQAALNRSPEKDGVGYWIAQLDKGVSLHTVAQGFINSPEFSSLYGPAPSNAAFVDLLYHNVLHRNGDQEGIHYWNQKLDSGTTRAQVLIGFSESPENQAALIGQIGDGFSYTLHR